MIMTKINMIHAMPDGICNIENEKIWNYPIFVGVFKLHSIGPDYLKTELYLEKKKYYLVFVEKELGMVIKAKVPYEHVTYMIREVLSRELQISTDESVSEEEIDKVLSRTIVTG